jgi:hypothetical protein
MKKASKVKMGMSKKLVKASNGYSVTSQTTTPPRSGIFGLSAPTNQTSRSYVPPPGAKKKEVSKERDASGNYVVKEKKITTPQGSKTVQKKRRTGLGFLRNALYEVSGGKIGQDVPRPMKKGGIVKKSKKK